MKHFAVLIIAAVQVMTIHAVTFAQSESSPTVATDACIPQGAAIAKGESRPPCPPTQTNTGFGFQISGRLDVLSKTEAIKTLVDDGVLVAGPPPTHAKNFSQIG